MKSFGIIVGLLLSWLVHRPGYLFGQSAHYPLDPYRYQWIDHLMVKSGNPADLITAIKPFPRIVVFKHGARVDSIMPNFDRVNSYWLMRLADEQNDWFMQNIETGEQPGHFTFRNSKKTFLKHFYKTPVYLYEADQGGFSLNVNPLLNLQFGSGKNDGQLIFENQRGIQLWGQIDDKVYFHMEILESQARFPDYVRQYTKEFRAVPGAGFYKSFNSDLFDLTEAVDFFTARGYIGARISQHVHIELGHNRHFIGEGLRSLFLSDFSGDYFYLKLNTRVWKLHYQNLWGELSVISSRHQADNELLPKKYFATHYLGFQVLKNLQIGLFETVIFSRNNQFELQYLNPIILYRTVEGSLGSPDNVLVGLQARWDIRRQVSLYGQLVVDEFKINELKSGSGWWGNKFGWQLGMKGIDLLGISSLDGQLEFNQVRPYTYSHRDSSANYSHFHQALAHPLGANFREVIFRLSYEPVPRVQLSVLGFFAKTGQDQEGTNYGSNILLPNSTREQNFNNRIGQGVGTKITLFQLEARYELFPNLYCTVNFLNREKRSDLSVRNLTSQVIYGGIQWNMTRRTNLF